jgi:hypothetical protein
MADQTRTLGDPHIEADVRASGLHPIVIVRHDEAVGVLPPPRGPATPGREIQAGRGPLSIDEIAALAGTLQQPRRAPSTRPAPAKPRRTLARPTAGRPPMVMAARAMRDDVMFRRALPSFGMAAEARPPEPVMLARAAVEKPRKAPAKRPPPPDVTCYFAAQMDAEVKLKRVLPSTYRSRARSWSSPLAPRLLQVRPASIPPKRSLWRCTHARTS